VSKRASGRFEDKVAVVTGAANGFGLEVATRLASEGAKPVLVDVAADALAEAAAKLDGVAVVANVAEESEVDRYVQEAVNAHGRIDLFYNNAGIEGRMAPMTELSVADFDRVWAVNARGVFMGLRAVLKVMKPQGSGVIVNTASMAAIKGAATFSPYIASKHAVLGLTKSAALEGAPFGIRVNCVAPGHIDTRMGRDLTAQINPDDPESVYRQVSASVPLYGRYGTAAEVANLVVFLLSDEAEYISGSLHLIDGALNAG
jgi:NAD(P)-dependent dehydrogenase (short-subunit alcohol dehydrogenase family)